MHFEPSAASYGEAPHRPTLEELRRRIAADRALLGRLRGDAARAVRHRIHVEELEIKRRQVHARASSAPKASAGAHPVGAQLGKRIARVKARIKMERKAIRETKRAIAAAAGVGVAAGLATLGAGAIVSAGAAAGLADKLHRLELHLHRDRHLLRVLHAAAASKNPTAIATAEKASAAADAGQNPATVSGYPAPTTPEPAPKTVEAATQEAIAEAADPSGATAEALDSAAAGAPSAAGEAPTTADEADAVAKEETGAAGDQVHELASSPGDPRKRGRHGGLMLAGALALGAVGLFALGGAHVR